MRWENVEKKYVELGVGLIGMLEDIVIKKVVKPNIIEY